VAVLGKNNLKGLKSMQKKFRIVSALLIVVLLMSALATLVSAGLGNDKGQEQG